MTRALLAIAALVAAVLAIAWLSARDLAARELVPEREYHEHDGTAWRYVAPPEWVTTTSPRWDN